MSSDDTAATGPRTPRQRAGVFDIRALIGLLLGIYGVMLLVTGVVATSQAELAKANGVNVNLYTGIGLVLASAVFFVWARLRPVLVPMDQHEQGDRGDGDAPPAP
jgi:uncharacterized membrane protein YidH (DUF202 family)